MKNGLNRNTYGASNLIHLYRAVTLCSFPVTSGFFVLLNQSINQSINILCILVVFGNFPFPFRVRFFLSIVAARHCGFNRILREDLHRNSGLSQHHGLFHDALSTDAEKCVEFARQTGADQRRWRRPAGSGLAIEWSPITSPDTEMINAQHMGGWSAGIACCLYRVHGPARQIRQWCPAILHCPFGKIILRFCPVMLNRRSPPRAVLCFSLPFLVFFSSSSVWWIGPFARQNHHTKSRITYIGCILEIFLSFVFFPSVNPQQTAPPTPLFFPFFLRENFSVRTFLRGNFVRSRSFPCSDWPLAIQLVWRHSS